jgi:hypothetical protein
MAYLHQGRIFWHEVPDKIGDGQKLRPLFIIDATEKVNDPNVPTVVCVACSHSSAERNPLPPQCVLIPEKCGKFSSRLHKTTAAVCDWLVEVPKQAIDHSKVAGSMGHKTLIEILTRSRQHVLEFQRQKGLKRTDESESVLDGPSLEEEGSKIR